MKVLITGATGFIGRKLVAKLIANGHEVVALVRTSSNTSALPDVVDIREGDLFDIQSLEPLLGDVQVVIHLAAYFDFYPSDVDLLYRVNVEGTKNVMNACIGTNVERFIYGSTAEVTGPVRYPPGNEDTELLPQFDYSKSKKMAEEAIREITKDTEMNHIILRPTGVMGEGDTYTALELLQALNNGEIPVLPGDGEKHIMYTHVDDVVDSFAAAVTSNSAINNTLLICPNEPMKYKEVITFLGDALGVKPPKRRVPTSLAKIGIGLMVPIKNRKRTTFLWHMKTIESMDQERWYSNERAKRLLGWSPKVTMKEGLERQIEWAWKEGLLEKKKM
ncbi:MAG: NAD(P)-dependent oxidoreductase [Candidatus Thorarchaeota archaeon]|nr:NAD(P)-dependent oxidoreductase [Candidatus Thorarchaeota archaeon]